MLLQFQQILKPLHQKPQYFRKFDKQYGRHDLVLQDDQKYRDEAIRAATANAIADAQSLASAASLQLIGILDIALGSGQSHQPMRRLAYAQAESTPITPGAVEISASVSVTYEIGPKN